MAVTLLLCGFGRGTADGEPQETAVAGPGQIRDLTEAFDVILNGATKEYIAGYAIDETFLMWLAAEYGDEAVIRAAYCVLDGQMEENRWYENTGESIHVLWLRFRSAIAPAGAVPANSGGVYSEKVYWPGTAEDTQAVFAFTGDFNFAENWYTTDFMKNTKNGIRDCFSEELLAKMREADVLLMNNEFAYSEEGSGTPVAGKAYIFRAEPDTAKMLSVFGVDIVSLANNHAYDYGREGLLDTMRHLDEAGIPYIGAGEDLDEASRVASYVVNGRKVAIVSATQIERSANYTKAATEHEAGVFKALNPDALVQVIKAAKKKNDYVIAVLHWGSEGTLMPDALEIRLAEQVVDAGADVVIGGHPHRLQGATFIREVPVAYSLGNFWFSDGTLYTSVAQVVIDADGGLRLQYLPCEQKDMVTRLLVEPEEIDEFYRYLAAVSIDVGIDAGGNVYDKKAGDYPAEDILYDSDTSELNAYGMADNEGYAIDIVGNRK